MKILLDQKCQTGIESAIKSFSEINESETTFSLQMFGEHGPWRLRVTRHKLLAEARLAWVIKVLSDMSSNRLHVRGWSGPPADLRPWMN